uniref:Uncharacterized protein n=1 Tax=Pediastrum duplex TaxID=3105 RepID=A0A2U8GJ99_PEDDU|nr:hypothetical protein [Pediastrum duplex]AWI68531.1 hypothetical protein [Pediastrum duplex]
MKRSSMYSVFFRFFAFASSVRLRDRRACATDAKALSLPSSASVLRRRRRSEEPKELKRGEGCTEPKPKNRSATEEPMRTEVAALRLRLRFLSLLSLRSRVGAPRLFAPSPSAKNRSASAFRSANRRSTDAKGAFASATSLLRLLSLPRSGGEDARPKKRVK